MTTLAAFVPFQSGDVVITLGDYVDRGPDSCAVLDWLIHFKTHGQLVALRGNHEVMMLAARDSESDLKEWLHNGGNSALASHSPFGDKGRLVDVPDLHWRFIEETLSWHEIESHFFVHANAYPNCPVDEQPELMLFWEQFHDPRPHVSGKTMVCGHTPQKSGRPRNLGHAVCIDTDACRGGWLTCLDVHEGVYWQANEQGETRLGLLSIAI